MDIAAAFHLPEGTDFEIQRQQNFLMCEPAQGALEYPLATGRYAEFWVGAVESPPRAVSYQCRCLCFWFSALCRMTCGASKPVMPMFLKLWMSFNCWMRLLKWWVCANREIYRLQAKLMFFDGMVLSADILAFSNSCSSIHSSSLCHSNHVATVVTRKSASLVCAPFKVCHDDEAGLGRMLRSKTGVLSLREVFLETWRSKRFTIEETSTVVASMVVKERLYLPW